MAEQEQPDALERATQGLISAAVAVNAEVYSYPSGECWIPTGAEQTLQMAVDDWRAAGGKTVEEQE